MSTVYEAGRRDRTYDGRCTQARVVIISMDSREQLATLPTPPLCGLRQGARGRASKPAYKRVRVARAGGAATPEMPASAIEKVELVLNEAIERPEPVPQTREGASTSWGLSGGPDAWLRVAPSWYSELRRKND
jgi:hypothetical protein